MRMMALVALALLLPTAAGYLVIAAVRGSRRLAELRYQPPPPEPQDRLAARLRRLRAELDTTEFTSSGLAKHHHVRAVRGAYLDVLGDACDRLQVSRPPGGDSASQADIFRAEAALRARGLDVREPVTR